MARVVGEVIRQQRKTLGKVSQEDFEEMTGYYRTYIGNIERGLPPYHSYNTPGYFWDRALVERWLTFRDSDSSQLSCPRISACDLVHRCSPFIRVDAVPGFALNKAPVVLSGHLGELHGIFVTTGSLGVIAQYSPLFSVPELVILLAENDTWFVIETWFVISRLLKKVN